MGEQNEELPVVFGYMGHFALSTNFFIEKYGGVHNAAAEYPMLCSIIDRYAPQLQSQLNGKVSPRTVVAARYTHVIDYTNFSLRDLFGKSAEQLSVMVTATKFRYAERVDDLPGRDMWGRFIDQSDEVAIELRINTDKIERFSARLSHCIGLHELYRKSKELGANNMLDMSTKLGSFDDRPLRELVFLRDAIEGKWKEKRMDTELYANPVLCLQEIKPCCVYSYYAALLKRVYSSKETEFANRIWPLFVKSLRFQWESSRSFSKLYPCDSSIT